MRYVFQASTYGISTAYDIPDECNEAQKNFDYQLQHSGKQAHPESLPSEEITASQMSQARPMFFKKQTQQEDMDAEKRVMEEGPVDDEVRQGDVRIWGMSDFSVDARRR